MRLNVLALNALVLNSCAFTTFIILLTSAIYFQSINIEINLLVLFYLRVQISGEWCENYCNHQIVCMLLDYGCFGTKFNIFFANIDYQNER